MSDHLSSNPLVDRLRKRMGFYLNGAAWIMSYTPDRDCVEAADEIERLTREHGNEVTHCNQLCRENDSLRAALDDSEVRFADARMHENRLRAALEEIAAVYPRPALTAARALVVARNALAGAADETDVPR